MTMRTHYIYIWILITAYVINAQWSTDPNNNLVVAVGWDPHIVSDSAGGCYITYNYGSFYPQKLAVERLDKYGYKPWGDKKQILGELPEQWQAQIIEDGEGGVIVSYDDNQVVGTDFTSRVRVQKVDSAGNFLWGQTGVRVTTEETNHGQGGLVSDGDGGCVIVWQNYDERILMNRIDRFGRRVWSETGIFLINTGTSIKVVRASDGNYYAQVNRNLYRISQNGTIIRRDSVTLGYPVPDPEGGVILIGKVWNGMIPKLVAQRKDSLGNNLWQEPYVEIADSLHINTMLSIIQYRGYYLYGWMGRKNGDNEILQIQGIRHNGTLLFNEGSISLSDNPGGTTHIPIIPSDSGSCLFISNYTNTFVGTFGQKIDTLGLLKWNSNQVLLSYPELNYLNTTTDCAGGAIGVGYYNSDFGIRVFKVSSKGILGEIITVSESKSEEIVIGESFLFQNYPNPFNYSTIIKYQIPKEGQVRILLYNILGEKLKILSDEYQYVGTYTLTFYSNDLSSGIYLYTLETGLKVLTKKLTIIK